MTFRAVRSLTSGSSSSELGFILPLPPCKVSKRQADMASRSYDTLSWGPFSLNVANLTDDDGRPRSALVQKRPKKSEVIRFEPPNPDTKANTSSRIEQVIETAKPPAKTDSSSTIHLTPREILQLHNFRTLQKQPWSTISEEMGYPATDLRTYWHTQLQPPQLQSSFSQDPKHPLTPLQVLQLQQLVEAGVDWWDMADILGQPIDVLRTVWHAMMPMPPHDDSGTHKHHSKRHNKNNNAGNGDKALAKSHAAIVGSNGAGEALTPGEALRLAHLKQSQTSWKEIAAHLSKPQDVLKRVWKEELEEVVKELGQIMPTGRAAAARQHGEPFKNKDGGGGGGDDNAAHGSSGGGKKHKNVQFAHGQMPEWRLSFKELSQLQKIVTDERESLWHRISHRFSEASGRFVRPEDIRSRYQA